MISVTLIRRWSKFLSVKHLGWTLAIACSNLFDPAHKWLELCRHKT
jgi:hypothetical protein